MQIEAPSDVAKGRICTKMVAAKIAVVKLKHEDEEWLFDAKQLKGEGVTAKDMRCGGKGQGYTAEELKNGVKYK